MSTTEICLAANLTRPTLYQYFGGKRQLLVAVHEASMERDLKPYLDRAASIEDPMERLTYMVRTYTRDIICVYPELRVLIHDALTTKDRQYRDVKAQWKRHHSLFRGTIEEIQKRGGISPAINPSLTALFLLGMLTWTTYWFDFGHGGGREEVSGIAETLVFNALGIRGASPSCHEGATKAP